MLDPRGLWVFADFVAERLAAPSAVLHEIDGARATAIVSSSVPERILDAYNGYYHKVNPLLPAALERIGTGRTACISDLLPERVYFASEFFCDFARGAETAWVLGLNVVIAPGRQLAIALHRPMGTSDFAPADRARLKRLERPVQAALRLRDRLGAGRDACLGALEALAFGAIVCDGDGRLLFANHAAEALARGGCGLLLGIRRGGVTAAPPHEASRLAQLIEDAAETARAGAMTIAGAGGQRTVLLIAPLPRRFGHAAQLVLVTVRSAAAAPLVDAATLIAVFGLTPAEAGVGVALSTGAGAAEIADRLGVAEETVRTHIRRCLSKAGAANQRAFIAMLGRLPPVRAGAGEPN